jgi:hypothetical protein
MYHGQFFQHAPIFTIMKAPITLLAVMAGTAAWAQLTITDNLPIASIAELLEGTGVTITNVEVLCNGASMGHFIGSSDLPIEEGLLLTTGSASQVAGPASTTASMNSGGPSDPDLMAIAGSIVVDACVLRFDCIPMGDTLLFNYVFGSEEYPEFVCNFNDVFGLFLSGPGIAGPYTNNAVNVALIPGTQTPISINTVNGGLNNDPSNTFCPAVNEQYYINNTQGTTVAYDGFTVNLVATAVVVPGETYTFKLAVGDAMDAIYDSGVFLEAFSFRSFGISTGLDDLQAIKPQLLREADALTVVFPEGIVVNELRLVSASGKEISRHRVQGDRVRLHMADLAPGVYIVQALGDVPLLPLRFVQE